MSPIDPIKRNLKRMRELRKEYNRLKAETAELKECRKQWPKLVRISVGKGKWGEEVLEAFAEIGWTVDGDERGTNLGPVSNGKYIAAQAWLIYEAHEDGTLKLVGAEDQSFGKVGGGET